MDPTFEKFCSNFHSLPGVTIAEKRKNFSLFLNNNLKYMKDPNTNVDFSSLRPTTSLEEIFKVEMLVYFRRVPELLQVLKEENPILIQKVLNASPWFIKEAFGNMCGTELVQTIFPFLSYIIKLKLLHKLSLHLGNIGKADEYFDAVKETYGVYLASKLLSACSASLIMNCIEFNRIELTPAQLLIIVKRYPELIEEILKKLNHRNAFIPVACKYSCVFNHIMHNHIQLYRKLKPTYDLSNCLGHRTSKKLIAEEKLNLVQNPRQYRGIVKRKQIHKKLNKEEFQILYRNFFPDSLTAFMNDNWRRYIDLLQHIHSDGEKMKLFSTTFKNVYQSEWWEYPMFSSLFETMPPEERSAWISTHSKPENISEVDWISLTRPEESIPLLKEKILLTSKIQERAKLIRALIKTCKFNDNDATALLDICKYMFNRHKNDHVSVRQEFFNTLLSSFELYNLSEEHWRYINDLVALHQIKEQDVSTCNHIREEYIQFCLAKNLPIKNLLEEWQLYMEYSWGYNICNNKPEYEKKCLLLLNDIVLQKHYIKYLESLISWNLKNPKDKISLFINAEAIDCLKSKLEKEENAYNEEQITVAAILENYEKAEEAGLTKVLLQRKKYSGPNRKYFIKWLLKKHPLYCLDNIHFVTLYLIAIDSWSDHIFEFSFLRYYSHIGIPQKMSELCINMLQDDDMCTRRKMIINILSYCMTAPEFLTFSNRYYPISVTADINSIEGQKIYKIQQALLPRLKTVNPPRLALDSILSCCKRDYLSLVLGSIYSVCHKVAENRLLQFFSALQNLRGVSVKKHVIFLVFKVLNKADTYKMLTLWFASENNSAIHKSLFKGIFNFFLRNADDYSWDMTKQCIQALNPKDKEAFNVLSKSHMRVSPTYFVKYILYAWDILENFADPNETIAEGKTRLLGSINKKNIFNFSSEFCEQIITKYLCKSPTLDNFQMKVHLFACRYILYHQPESDFKKRIGITCEILKNHMNSDCSNKVRGVNRKIAFNFIEELCSQFLNKECQNKGILCAFITSWNSFAEPYHTFEHYLRLQFTTMYLECLKEDELDKNRMGHELAKLCDRLHDEKSIVVNIFCDCLDLFLKTYKIIYRTPTDSREEGLLSLIKSIQETSRSPSSLMIIVHLLTENSFQTRRIRDELDIIIESLWKVDNYAVHINLGTYLINKA